jgi:hypothetical protein
MAMLSNPAVRALPLLLLARLHRLEGNLSEAKDCFKAWQSIKNQVQYTAIHALAEEVHQDLFFSKGDSIFKNELPDSALNKKDLTLQLEKYIFGRLASRTDLTDSQRAEIWGGSRPAYLRRQKQVMGLTSARPSRP